MHELSVATEIRRMCRARIPDSDPAPLERVRVRIGELSAIEPDLLRYAWEAATAEGPDAGATLEIEWRPARQVCATCGEIERETGTWVAACPSCGRTPRIEGGMELDVIEFSYAAGTGVAQEPR